MLKELARGIACVFSATKSPVIDALEAIPDSWLSLDWDSISPQRQDALTKLNEAGLVEQRIYFTITDEFCRPVIRSVSRGHGRGWTLLALARLRQRARQVSGESCIDRAVQTEKLADYRRTEAGRQLIAGECLAHVEKLNGLQPPVWQLESEQNLWATASGGAVAMAAASASIGDINVTVNPQIVVNQPAPVVNVHVVSPPSVATGPAISESASPSGELSAEDRAIAILAKHPELSSIAAIAELAGCTRQHLANPKKCPRFNAAWEIAQSPSRAVLRGSKSKEGAIEAWE